MGEGMGGGSGLPDPDKIKQDEMQQDGEWVFCMYNSFILNRDSGAFVT